MERGFCAASDSQDSCKFYHLFPLMVKILHKVVCSGGFCLPRLRCETLHRFETRRWCCLSPCGDRRWCGSDRRLSCGVGRNRFQEWHQLAQPGTDHLDLEIALRFADLVEPGPALFVLGDPA